MPVELAIQPITALEKSVLADETILKTHIGKFKSRYVTDGLLHNVFRLPNEIRDPLLPPLPLLKLEQRHSVGRITYLDNSKKHFWSIDRIMTSVLDQNSNPELRFYLEPMMADNVDLTTMEGRGELENLDAASVVVVLDAISDHSDEKEVNCSTNQKLKEGSYLGVYHPYAATHNKTNLHYRDGQFIALSPGEGVVLEYKSSEEGLPYWDKVAIYHNEERTVQMNPLLQERLDFNDRSISNGQYHLPVRAIKELSMLKRKYGICPAVYSCGHINDENSLRSLKKYVSENVANGRGKAVFSILVVNASASHMIAVRFIQAGNKIVVYLHETIQPTSAVAADIRNFIINAISGAVKNIHDNSLYFLTPPASGYLQKDFSSCSMTAFKVLLSFEKERNGLDPFFIQLLGDVHSDISLVDYQAFNTEGSVTCGKQAKMLPENIKVGSVPLTSLPAVLLKFYQGSQDLLSEHQKTTIVSNAKKLTLKDYYLRHRFLDPETDKTFNMAALCKTSKAFAMWKDLIRNFTPLFIRILKIDFEKVTKYSINHWLNSSMYLDIEINGNDLKMLKRYKNFITMEADLNTWPEDAVLKWWNLSKELSVWLKGIRPKAMTMNTNQLLWRWCQFLNNYLDSSSDVGRLWFRRDVGYVIERLDARLKLLRKTGRSDFPFHFGERVYREPEYLPGPVFEGQPIYRDTRCFYIKTEVRESMTEPGRFNRIVMTFPKPLLLASADNERNCYDSVSDTSEAEDKSLLPSGESCPETSAAIAAITKAESVLDSSEERSPGASLTISDSYESMDPELQCEEKFIDSHVFSQDYSPVRATTPEKKRFPEMAKEAVQSGRVQSSFPLKRERAELDGDFLDSSIKKQRFMTVSIPSGNTAAPDLAEQANSVRRNIEKNEFKVAIEMLSMVIQGIWTLDVASKAKASRKLKILKQAIEKICEISKRPNELDIYLMHNNVSGLPGLHDTHKRALTLSYVLDYLFQILCAAGEQVVDEPLAIITAARLFIVRNTEKNDCGVAEEGNCDLMAVEFPNLFETASASELSENQSDTKRVIRIRREFNAIGYLMASERINTVFLGGTTYGKVKLIKLLIGKVCSLLGTKNGSMDFLDQLKFEKSLNPSQKRWIKIAALHEYLSSLLPGHSSDKSLTTILLTAESYLKEQAENSASKNLP
ncbi:hypothetical protein [Endozoicomonas sp. YOMI1]|uniref:hypothetical protein n=1 Tax=Endozoicomonas sp. YOMI1 TaxID=2828739 RepID=UPI002148953C|nr:hypothetical protein [Endozoicomonas sp. YOMI1]